ncbi:MAG: tyrosine-type recombinase/integrase [Rhizobiales bacterium]|nr:tyrosine-type recombinase/integrase [Hyphomicrobiales bacterium]MBO6700347.1 tyrosine-type recombinase/integrase [Hyphomicrobiales bacterium]MBO6737488.1 tyrosine-type recombinase/integrase [Hyphomicrobiales bacterium]MBO6913455.1 tyrosine-type recombinase/integrase [Hyphomicrobiales bacterium]MBO6955386.1 tyrosine-type recombinase/integrase [Hyphomicrobiales bacterium]
MKRRLTPKTINALPPATGKRYEVRDALLPGLHLRVSATGGKVFYLSTRVHGHMKRIKIGSWPVLTLHDAREKARTLLRSIELGRYVEKAPYEAEQRTKTLGEIVPEFISLYAKQHTKDWKGTERVLLKFSPLFSRPIDQIRRAEIHRVLDTIIADGAPTRANRALAAIKKLMNWCIDRGIIETSPVAALRPPTKEVARERVLSDRELVTCYRMAELEGFPFAPCVQMMMLTGQRRGEVSGMRWSELDLDNALWSLPSARVKNATAHIVPLAPMAVDILRSIPRFQRSDLVFTTTGTTPISGFGRLKERLDAAFVDAEDWRFHDLRRTMATNMAMMGVAPHIIEAVLNHKSGIVSGVAAVYNRHAYLDEKRGALELWAKKLTELTKPTVSAPRQLAI